MLKASHKPVRLYHAALAQFGEPMDIALKQLLGAAATSASLVLQVCEENEQQIRGHLVDEYGLFVGAWIHFQDETLNDYLISVEIENASNLLIHHNGEFLLYHHHLLQSGADGHDGVAVVDILEEFCGFSDRNLESWYQIARHYEQQLPIIEKNLYKALPSARKNELFLRRFKAFHQLCKSVLSHNFSTKQVDALLVQHYLSKPLSQQGFHSEIPPENNLLLWEMDQIWQVFPPETLSLQDVVTALQPLFWGIGQVLDTLRSDEERSGFMQSIAKRFFGATVHQNPPKEVLDFLCKGISYLISQTGQSINDKGFPIVDLYAQEGAVISHLMHFISQEALVHKYQQEIFCNEINLINYHVCTANIKQQFRILSKRQENFNGLCWIDSAELIEPFQITMFDEKNASRIEQQRHHPPKLIIGEVPPSLNDAEEVSQSLQKRIQQTYGHAISQFPERAHPLLCTLRIATDILANQGSIAFILPQFDLNKPKFAAFRDALFQEFERIFLFKLGSDNNAEVNLPFQLLFLQKDTSKKGLFFAEFPNTFTTSERLSFLAETPFASVEWHKLTSPKKWEAQGKLRQFQAFVPLFSLEELSIFKSIWNVRDAQKAEAENRLLCINFQPEFGIWTTQGVSSVDLSDSLIFPFYYIDKDLGIPTPSISDETVQYFRQYYREPEIHRWGIWHYVYALLHHPNYRKRFAAHLQDGLPRIPMVERFFAWSEIGKTLAGIHLSIAQLQVYPLDFQTKGIPKLPENVKDYKVLGQSLISCATGGKKIATSFRKPLGQWATMALETKRIIGGMEDLGLKDAYGGTF